MKSVDALCIVSICCCSVDISWVVAYRAFDADDEYSVCDSEFDVDDDIRDGMLFCPVVDGGNCVLVLLLDVV